MDGAQSCVPTGRADRGFQRDEAKKERQSQVRAMLGQHRTQARKWEEEWARRKGSAGGCLGGPGLGVL